VRQASLCWILSLALDLALTGCVLPEMTHEGRSCGADHPCAAGYVCSPEGRCARPAGTDLDLSSGDAPRGDAWGDLFSGDGPRPDAHGDGPRLDKGVVDKRPPDKRPPDTAPACPTTWVTQLAGKAGRAHVDPADGSIYVVGSDAAGNAQVTRLSKCGVIVSKASISSSYGSLANSVSSLGADLLVGGWVKTASGRRGLIAAFDKTPALKWSIQPVLGTTVEDELWDAVQFGQTIWAQGTLDLTGTNNAWEVRTTLAGGTPCSFSPSSGIGRRVWTDGTSVYLTGSSVGAGTVLRYPSSCGVASCSTCAPDWKTTFQDGTSGTEGRDLTVVGGNLYVAGFSVKAAGDLASQIFRIALSSGATTQQVAENPTGEGDLWGAVATDGTYLYVGGTRGYTGDGTGTAVLRKLSLVSLTVQWTVALPQDHDYYRGVALTPDGGVIVTGGNSSTVRRCTTGGAC